VWSRENLAHRSIPPRRAVENNAADLDTKQIAQGLREKYPWFRSSVNLRFRKPQAYASAEFGAGGVRTGGRIAIDAARPGRR
jgi:hypothetical protein